MSDSGALGGLHSIGRLGQDLPRRSRGEPQHSGDGESGGQQAPAPAEDLVDLCPVAAAVLPLLEQRVLAATRRIVSPGQPAVGTIVRTQAASSPRAVVARIQSAQHWVAGPGGAPEPLRAAFVAGLDETEAIVREVAGGDERALHWLAAVRELVAN